MTTKLHKTQRLENLVKSMKHIGKYQIMVWSWVKDVPFLHAKHFIGDVYRANKKRKKYEDQGFDVHMWVVKD